MEFELKMQFLKAFITHYTDEETGKTADYYKVAVFLPDGFNRSPAINISQECFEKYKLADDKVQLSLRNMPMVTFVCSLSFFGVKTNVTIIDIKELNPKNA